MIHTTTPISRRMILFLFYCALTAHPLLVHANTTYNTATTNHADAIVEWIRLKGGFFHEKLEFRRMSQTSPSYGVYSKGIIEVNETIMKIPKSCFVTIENPTEITETTTSEEWHSNYCVLAKKLLMEIDKGSQSDFAPYMEYLRLQKRGQTPATWSDSGKDLLRQLLPADHDGVDWLDMYHKKAGCIDMEDEDERQRLELAVATVVQRGFDNYLVPIWDMVNHDNGKMNTATNSLHEDVFHVWASQTLNAGDEIYHSYDLCIDCLDIATYWGTPEILRDFGFVESYPQRWVFWNEEHPEDSVYFEMEENSQHELEVFWDRMKPSYDEDEELYPEPNEAGVRFIQTQLDRLHQVQLTEQGDVPDHEWSVIQQYHQAATIAFTMAMELATSGNAKKSECGISADEL